MDGAAPAATPTPTPAPTPAAPVVAPVVAAKPMSPKTKKMIIIFSIVGVAVAAIVVCLIIFLPMLFGVDWKETKEAAEDFYKANNSISSECSDAMSYVSSTYTSKSDYDKYVSKCSDAMNGYIEAADKIGETSGVKRNDAIKKKYEAFKKDYDEAKPIISGIGELLSAEHEVVLGADEISDMDDVSSLDDSSIEDLVKPLRNVSSDGVKDIANTMADKVEEYLKIVVKYQKAYKKWYDTSYSDPNYNTVRDEYYAARDAYYDADLDMDMSEVTDKLGGLDDTAEELYNTIRSEYKKNN